MERKRVSLPGKMSAIHRSMLAAATGLAIASSAVALVPAVQITSGSMTVSQANPSGAWTLAGTDLSAGGNFIPDVERPGGYVSPINPMPLGTSVTMTWLSDSIDGWTGQMVLHGVAYHLTGDANNNSFMNLTANDIVLSRAGSYIEPFTFTATLCGFFTTIPVVPCDATANLVGMGSLDLVVVPDPHFPQAVDIQSLSYRFAGVPEPASIALLLIGLVGLGLARRRTSVRQE